jgi:hypothetical protein
MSESWVYENWTLRKAVLHRGECGACKHGRGQHGGGETENGKWHGPYSSADTARSDAPIRTNFAVARLRPMHRMTRRQLVASGTPDAHGELARRMHPQYEHVS